MQNIDVILCDGENYKVEFKENADKSLASEVCAFANASGGCIFIGVDDNGKIIGTDISNTARSRIQDTINQVEPKLNVEISNPGGVPKGITNKNFGTLSIARNPVLASLLHRIHYIEKMGTGIERIKKDLKDAKQQVPKFSTSGFFKITLRRANVTEKVPEKGTEKGTEKITINQQKIIKNLLENPNITSEELSVIIGIRADKIRVNLSKLKSKGLIERVGADKGGYWRVKV